MQPLMQQPVPPQGAAPDEEQQPQPPMGGPPQPQPPGAQQGGGGKQAIARLAIAATKAIYEDKATTDQIVQMLKQGAENPAQAVCDVAIHILDGLAEKVGGGAPKQIAYVPDVAMGVIGELGELGEHAGAFQWSDQEAEKAAQYLADKVRPRLQGGGAQPGQPQSQQQPPQQPPPGPGAAGSGQQAPGGGLLNQEVY